MLNIISQNLLEKIFRQRYSDNDFEGVFQGPGRRLIEPSPNLSPAPESHMGEGENQLPQVSCSIVDAYRHTNVIQK